MLGGAGEIKGAGKEKCKKRWRKDEDVKRIRVEEDE